MISVHVFCVECGHQEADVDMILIEARWDGSNRYRFECPRCVEFRSVPASDVKAFGLLAAGVDLVVQPVDGTLLKLAIIEWSGRP